MALDFTDSTTYSVSASISIAHSYHFNTDVFNPESLNLADFYMPWKRCLAIVDHSVYNLYGEQIKTYFRAHGIAATIQPVYITEDRKDVEALLEICGWITDFNILRREPVLVIGGGLVTDVAGLRPSLFLIYRIETNMECILVSLTLTSVHIQVCLRHLPPNNAVYSHTHNSDRPN